jgi:multicomponent K+:H+ antiporter subunit D
MPHLMLAPIALPMFHGCADAAAARGAQRLKLGVNCCPRWWACWCRCLAAMGAPPGAAVGMGVYLPGNWPAPFGIVLVLDRLSALMLLLTSLVALAGAVRGRWQRAGVLFHALFQFQLMGLNGAFLTGDLFNLFVFFEIMLAASYGLLLLHGSGRARAVWPALHRHQPGGLVAVPDRRGHALRPHRHAEHGRPGPGRAPCCRPTGACCTRRPPCWPRPF